MTSTESEIVWNFLKVVYREYAKAVADAKALRTLLSLKNEPKEKIEWDLDILRMSEWYQKMLETVEAILQPMGKAFQEKRESELLELLRKLPVPKDLT
jgi:hypothetical protein